jgi:hypothetical protein
LLIVTALLPAIGYSQQSFNDIFQAGIPFQEHPESTNKKSAVLSYSFTGVKKAWDQDYIDQMVDRSLQTMQTKRDMDESEIETYKLRTREKYEKLNTARQYKERELYVLLSNNCRVYFWAINQGNKVLCDQIAILGVTDDLINTEVLIWPAMRGREIRIFKGGSHSFPEVIHGAYYTPVVLDLLTKTTGVPFHELPSINKSMFEDLMIDAVDTGTWDLVSFDELPLENDKSEYNMSFAAEFTTSTIANVSSVDLTLTESGFVEAWNYTNGAKRVREVLGGYERIEPFATRVPVVFNDLRLDVNSNVTKSEEYTLTNTIIDTPSELTKQESIEYVQFLKEITLNVNRLEDIVGFFMTQGMSVEDPNNIMEGRLRYELGLDRTEIE